jgi:hypothetical protein
LRTRTAEAFGVTKLQTANCKLQTANCKLPAQPQCEGEVEVEGGCGCAAQSECGSAARGNKINYAE